MGNIYPITTTASAAAPPHHTAQTTTVEAIVIHDMIALAFVSPLTAQAHTSDNNQTSVPADRCAALLPVMLLLLLLFV